MTDQRVLELGLGVLVLQAQKLQDVRAAHLLLHGHRIDRPRLRALDQHHCLVPGEHGALVELAADLTVELAHRPAAAQGLRFVELARLRIALAQQPDIGRPGQREAVAAVRQPRGRFSRQRLENVPVREIERPHLEEVALAEPAPEARGQVVGQAADEFLAVLRAAFAALLVHHDPSADLPVRSGHHGVDGARRRTSRLLEQCDHALERALVGRLSCCLFPGHPLPLPLRLARKSRLQLPGSCQGPSWGRRACAGSRRHVCVAPARSAARRRAREV